MTDVSGAHTQNAQQQSGAATNVPTVVAELSWTVPGRPPHVTLAFDGRHQPISLFADLHAIGWTVPPCPPRPASAIEWTPDPTTGEAFTILPWTVPEFKLGVSSWWTAEQAAGVGETTIGTLRTHGAEIRVLGDNPTNPAPAQTTPPTATPNAAPQPQAETPVAASPGDGALAVQDDTVRLLVVDPGFTGESTIAGVAMSKAVSGRKKAVSGWGESTHSAADVFANPEILSELNSRGGFAWTVAEGTQMPTASGSTVVVQMIEPALSAGDAKVKKLAKLLGKDAHVVPLMPVGNGSQAVLVWAALPAASAELLASNLRLRFPNGVLR